MGTQLKVAITGHTAGLGQALFDHFSRKNFIVAGFSRQNNFNISERESQIRLLEQITPCDLFINNAHSDWAQIGLLYAVFEKWQNQSKHIINIGSNSGDGIKNYIHSYAIQKNALDKATEQLNNIKDSVCRVTTLRPGWISTERIKEMNISEPQLSLQEMIDVVEWLIELPKTVHVSTISLTARTKCNGY